MRALVLLLVLANLAFFALAQGFWLGRKLDQVEAGAARTE